MICQAGCRPAFASDTQACKVRARGATMAGVTCKPARPRADRSGRAGCQSGGTPKETIARLHSEIVKTLNQSDTRGKLLAQGQIVLGTTPEQFTAVIQEETQRWGKVIKAATVRID